MDLQDKVAVITGGASGLGRATVKRFVANGAKLCLSFLGQPVAALSDCSAS